jgi:hypothetical protein
MLNNSQDGIKRVVEGNLVVTDRGVAHNAETIVRRATKKVGSVANLSYSFIWKRRRRALAASGV